MKIRINCADAYEAQKLASLVYLKESDETFIAEILNIVENELVVALKDKSAHSVMLKDVENAEVFADFLQSVIEKKHKISETATFGSDVEIIKS